MTSPRLDPNRLAIISDRMDCYGLGDPEADWPANIVSRRAVAYHDGTIVLAVVAVGHEVDEAEVATEKPATTARERRAASGSEPGERTRWRSRSDRLNPFSDGARPPLGPKWM